MLAMEYIHQCSGFILRFEVMPCTLLALCDILAIFRITALGHEVMNGGFNIECSIQYKCFLFLHHFKGVKQPA